jgi:hypothetical protein
VRRRIKTCENPRKSRTLRKTRGRSAEDDSERKILSSTVQPRCCQFVFRWCIRVIAPPLHELRSRPRLTETTVCGGIARQRRDRSVRAGFVWHCGSHHLRHCGLIFFRIGVRCSCRRHRRRDRRQSLGQHRLAGAWWCRSSGRCSQFQYLRAFSRNTGLARYPHAKGCSMLRSM